MWGLVTSATLSHLGHDVCCADIVPEKVAMLSRGETPMVEVGHSSRSSRIPARLPAGSWRMAKGAAWTSH
jgi:hypothetical protein